MKLTGNSYFILSFIIINVTFLPLINGQFFTKTSKSIPRMGRRSETGPVSKASLLQAIYGQEEATIDSDNLVREDQEVNQTNSPDRQLKSEVEEDGRLFSDIQEDKEVSEPEFKSIVIKNLKKVLRAYARSHRNDGSNID